MVRFHWTELGRVYRRQGCNIGLSLDCFFYIGTGHLILKEIFVYATKQPILARAKTAQMMQTYLPWAVALPAPVYHLGKLCVNAQTTLAIFKSKREQIRRKKSIPLYLLFHFLSGRFFFLFLLIFGEIFFLQVSICKFPPLAGDHHQDLGQKIVRIRLRRKNEIFFCIFTVALLDWKASWTSEKVVI